MGLQPNSDSPVPSTPASPSTPPVRVHIRWMIRRDMPEVLAIENATFEFPWSEEDFIRSLRQRNCVGMVGEVGDRVVAFMMYELHKMRVHMLNLAVTPERLRTGIGTQMLSWLKRKLHPQRRTRIVCEVRETNVVAQLFLRKAGFRAVSVLRDFYDDTTEDAYLMQCRYQSPGADTLLPVNRFKGLA